MVTAGRHDVEQQQAGAERSSETALAKCVFP